MHHYLLSNIPHSLVDTGAVIRLTPIQPAFVSAAVRTGYCSSTIKCTRLAHLLSAMLDVKLYTNYIDIPKLNILSLHVLVVYEGPWLPEECTTLPEGAIISFYKLECHTTFTG